jgi:hypothetical protein
MVAELILPCLYSNSIDTTFAFNESNFIACFINMHITVTNILVLVLESFLEKSPQYRRSVLRRLLAVA